MNREEMLLVKMMEECGEVIQACSKALRFGLDDAHPKQGNVPNRECISKEILDIFTIHTMLMEEGTIQDCWTPQAERAARVEKYLKLSKKLGRLSNE